LGRGAADDLSTKVMRFYSSLSVDGLRITGVAVGSEWEASRRAVARHVWSG